MHRPAVKMWGDKRLGRYARRHTERCLTSVTQAYELPYPVDIPSMPFPFTSFLWTGRMPRIPKIPISIPPTPSGQVGSVHQ